MKSSSTLFAGQFANFQKILLSFPVLYCSTSVDLKHPRSDTLTSDIRMEDASVQGVKIIYLFSLITTFIHNFYIFIANMCIYTLKSHIFF